MDKIKFSLDGAVGHYYGSTFVVKNGQMHKVQKTFKEAEVLGNYNYLSDYKEHSEKDVWKNEIFLPLPEVHLLTISITNEILVIIQVQRKGQITGTCMIWTAIKSYHEKTLRK